MISRTAGRSATRARAAFTLPELLVVVTVTLVLMSILVQASTIITNTVSEAKAQGDFVGQERMAIAIMRRDLQCDHFLEDDGNPSVTRGRKVSDYRLDGGVSLSADQKSILGYKPPKSGYFCAKAPGAAATGDNIIEGTDASGFDSSRSGNHFMQFTVVMRGGAPSDTMTADIPFQNANLTTATCAEVAYFLVYNGTTPNGIKYYKLIRRQRIAARNDDDAPAYAQILNRTSPQVTDVNDPPEVVATTGTIGNFKMLTLSDLTVLGNRVPRAQITNSRIGEDVLHNYVTSFQLMFKGSGRGEGNTQWPRPFSTTNTYYPYDTLPFDGEYDTGELSLLTMPTSSTANNPNLAGSATGSNTSRLKPIRLTGVQITLRCWNPANRQTRQTTTAVDL